MRPLHSMLATVAVLLASLAWVTAASVHRLVVGRAVPAGRTRELAEFAAHGSGLRVAFGIELTAGRVAVELRVDGTGPGIVPERFARPAAAALLRAWLRALERRTVGRPDASAPALPASV
jgi:hypothetical protein